MKKLLLLVAIGLCLITTRAETFVVASNLQANANVTIGNSLAQGFNAIASGTYSHAQGSSTTASGSYSHAEGSSTTASGQSSHAEGENTVAGPSNYSHAEGKNTTASGESSHAEGAFTIASGTYSHAAGFRANATNDYTWVWSGSSTAFGSTAANQFSVNALGGIRLLGSPIYGDGSGLTNIHGSNSIAAGTISTNRMDPTAYAAFIGNPYALTNGDTRDITLYGTLSASLTIFGALTGDARANPSFSVPNGGSLAFPDGEAGWMIKNDGANGLLFINGNSGNLILFAENGIITGNGAGLTNIHGSNSIAAGTISTNRMDATAYEAFIGGSGGTNFSGIIVTNDAAIGNDVTIGNDASIAHNLTIGNSLAQGGATTASGTYSHAQGFETTASGLYSHAQGELNTASGRSSHAEGAANTASGQSSHAEGDSTIASGNYSHAEGLQTTASGTYSHSAGRKAYATNSATWVWADGTTAFGSTAANQFAVRATGGIRLLGSPIYGDGSGLSNITVVSLGLGTAAYSNSTAFRLISNDNFTNIYVTNKLVVGSLSSAPGVYAFAQGESVTANGRSSHAEGYGTVAFLDRSHAEGNLTLAYGASSHAEGESSKAVGSYSHAEGYDTAATNNAAHAEGIQTIATNQAAHAEGRQTTAGGDASHAEGYGTLASGLRSHAEGDSTAATNEASHAQGYATQAWGKYSHAEGASTTASNYASHAEGLETIATGTASHAEGWKGQATGDFSHAEGYFAQATGENSHAEGYMSQANGDASHAEGFDTRANGENSHAEGYATRAEGDYSHAAGNAARATNNYTWVWASDNTIIGESTSFFTSTAERQFSVWATGGIRLLGSPIYGNGSGLTNISNTSIGYVTNASASTSIIDMSKTYSGASISGGITLNDLIGVSTGGTNVQWATRFYTNSAGPASPSSIAFPASWIGNTATHYVTNQSVISVVVYPGMGTNVIVRNLK